MTMAPMREVVHIVGAALIVPKTIAEVGATFHVEVRALWCPGLQFQSPMRMIPLETVSERPLGE